MNERTGLLLETDRGLTFLAARAASRVAQLGPVSAVRGLPPPAVGIALADGRVVTVVRLGTAQVSRVAILCEIDGDPIALAGARVVATGVFPAAPGGILHQGEILPELDVRAIYGELESALWASRALRHAKKRADARGDSDRPPRPLVLPRDPITGGGET